MASGKNESISQQHTVCLAFVEHTDLFFLDIVVSDLQKVQHISDYIINAVKTLTIMSSFLHVKEEVEAVA